MDRLVEQHTATLSGGQCIEYVVYRKRMPEDSGFWANGRGPVALWGLSVTKPGGHSLGYL